MQLLRTDVFNDWLASLDPSTTACVTKRLDRLAAGNPGDVSPVGAGVSELRLQFGPGYRIYYLQRGVRVAILLTAGDKSTQVRDIARALVLAEGWR